VEVDPPSTPNTCIRSHRTSVTVTDLGSRRSAVIAVTRRTHSRAAFCRLRRSSKPVRRSTHNQRVPGTGLHQCHRSDSVGRQNRPARSLRGQPCIRASFRPSNLETTSAVHGDDLHAVRHHVKVFPASHLVTVLNGVQPGHGIEYTPWR